ncbi:MAG TPA: hypothetical protein PKD20_05315, partial [Candidatus Saccharibacteria bacterium]|nr:hypothetical protein [Candidatus Saccharibacteria bacterium]
VPSGVLLDTHATGGYDTIDDQDGSVESMILVGDSIPKEARPFWVAHLVMHKTLPDDGTPHLCVSHDRCVQDFLSSTEPGLMKAYFTESTTAYRQGRNWYQRNGGIPLEIERYDRALGNSSRKQQDATDADKNRQRLADIGLVLPDDNVALNAVDGISGERTTMTLQTERGTRHRCKSCAHPIPRGSDRITTSTRREVNGYDHHHFHVGCFSHVALGIFGDFHQTEPLHPHGK